MDTKYLLSDNIIIMMEYLLKNEDKYDELYQTTPSFDLEKYYLGITLMYQDIINDIRRAFEKEYNRLPHKTDNDWNIFNVINALRINVNHYENNVQLGDQLSDNEINNIKLSDSFSSNFQNTLNDYCKIILHSNYNYDILDVCYEKVIILFKKLLLDKFISINMYYRENLLIDLCKGINIDFTLLQHDDKVNIYNYFNFLTAEIKKIYYGFLNKEIAFYITLIKKFKL